MGDIYLPIERESVGEGKIIKYNYFVMVDGERKELSGQITIYKKLDNERYKSEGSPSQNRDYENKYQANTYYIKKEDKKFLFGGSKTKRRQYRYRASSKKRVASRRRGRQTRYSRRK